MKSTLRAVIVSVKYGDMIKVTMPAWKAVLPPGSLSVVTSPEDIETQDVCRENDVPALITDAFTRIDDTCHAGGVPTFNCALAMDEALGLAGDRVPKPKIGDLICNINADCYPVGVWPDESTFDPGVLYGFWRHHCLTVEEFAAFRRGKRTVQKFPRMKNSGGRPVGYLQLWRYRDGERYRSYPNAGKYDTHFCDRWKPHFNMRPELALIHMGPQKDWDNWRSRVVPRFEVPA